MPAVAAAAGGRAEEGDDAAENDAAAAEEDAAVPSRACAMSCTNYAKVLEGKLRRNVCRHLLKVNAAAAVTVDDAHHLFNNRARGRKALNGRCVMCDVWCVVCDV
jgi:hypothetical protein